MNQLSSDLSFIIILLLIFLPIIFYYVLYRILVKAIRTGVIQAISQVQIKEVQK